jgi:hypothetical protein
MKTADLMVEAESFVEPSNVFSREGVLARPSPIPPTAGVYGWWFDTSPGDLDTSSCTVWNGLTLLYTGISPTRPPSNGKAASRSHLRQRIQTHYTGNAEGSTLRKTLGCLLADELGLELRRVGSGSRRTFVLGEPVLSQWMSRHAFVCITPRDDPWELEEHLIATVDLPLNLRGNSRNRNHALVTQSRAACVAGANAHEGVSNPGVGGR